MRIAFLCKRRYMGKDVVLDRYGRLYEIPRQLAERGHDVLGLCLSYHGDDEGQWRHDTARGSLRWISRSLGSSRILSLPRLLGHARWTLRRLQAFAPDYVIGASDIAHVALGAHCAARLRVRYAADLYDNFESFGMARIPGMKGALRRAVRDADLVSCTSEALAAHVRQEYAARGRVMSLPSTVDRGIFQPADRVRSRLALGLPIDALLVGTAGHLSAVRGISTLYEGFRQVATTLPQLHLVLAGPADPDHPPPKDDGVHYLGQLDHARVATLFAALDLGVIYLRDTPFGRYCFPQKAYEMAACGLPFIAADVGVMPSLLSAHPDHLYAADDASSLARALRHVLQHPAPPLRVAQDWTELVATLDEALAQHGPSGARLNTQERTAGLR